MDKTIKCKENDKEIVFTEREQEFYIEKGFEPPKRCKACRDARKNKYNKN